MATALYMLPVWIMSGGVVAMQLQIYANDCPIFKVLIRIKGYTVDFKRLDYGDMRTY